MILQSYLAKRHLLAPALRYAVARHWHPPVTSGACCKSYTWAGPLYTLVDDAEVSRTIQRQGYYDIAVAQALLDLLKPGMRVINVGANVGFFAVLAARKTRADVLCFEPDPRSLQALKSTARLYPQLQVHPVAVGDRNGDIDLILDSIPGNSALVAARGPSHSVRMVTLDRYLDRPADLLLMDVQGAEGLILRGLRDRIRGVRRILFEFWPFGLDATGSSVAEIYSLLHAAGFVMRHIGRTSLPDPESSRTALERTLRSQKAGQGFCNLLAERTG